MNHYTGKEHDEESGNDDFGARYYADTTGRWLSPDWAAAAEAVPYATFDNPQSLNLYSFVDNNPLDREDADGHCNSATGDKCSDAQRADTTSDTHNAAAGEKAGQDHRPQSQQQNASVIFGETSGLSSEVGQNGKPVTTPGANPNLKRARENVADISRRNSGVYSRTPTAAELKNPQVRAAWQASQAAAAGSNGSLPGYHFFLRQAGVGRQRPSKAQGWGQGKPVREYGPFKNVGGGDVPKGNRTYIDIYNR